MLETILGKSSARMAQATLGKFGFKTPSDAKSSDDNTNKSSTSKSTEAPLTSKSTEAETSKKKYPKRFQNKWLSEFSWLKFDDDKGTMYCLSCSSSSKSVAQNVFVTGCKNFQRSALVRHQTSDEHKISCLEKKQQVYMKAAVKIVTHDMQSILEAQLRTALYLASENIANRKFASIVDLQVCLVK